MELRIGAGLDGQIIDLRKMSAEIENITVVIKPLEYERLGLLACWML